MSANDLKDFIESFSGGRHLAVEETLADGYVRLKTSEAERRQAKQDIRCVEDLVIEMLRNARDAHARNIYLATTRNGEERTVVMIDDGDGIPSKMHELVFEPRVTSKLETMLVDQWGVHGRGMALYSIKSNVDSIRIAASVPGQGTSFKVLIDTDLLSERADQSSAPVIVRNESRELVVATGPHNIIRTAAEFALDSKGDVKVYLGSPAEIAATLIETRKNELAEAGLLFCEDFSSIPMLLRPAAAGDDAELVRACAELGLDMSERTAHRVFTGEIRPVEPLLDTLLPEERHDVDALSPDIFKDSRGLRVSSEDLHAFSRAVEGAFADLSRKYYIELSDEPIIRVGKDTITVKFPFEKEL